MKDISDLIYLDNHATTPCDPRVVDEMVPYLSSLYGNAASRSHRFGWDAKEAVDLSRDRVAGLIGATAKEIVFTSGATESNNLAIKGAAHYYEKNTGKTGHVITPKTEHKAVLDSCHALEEEPGPSVGPSRPGHGHPWQRGLTGCSSWARLQSIKKYIK